MLLKLNVEIIRLQLRTVTQKVITEFNNSKGNHRNQQVITEFNNSKGNHRNQQVIAEFNNSTGNHR